MYRWRAGKLFKSQHAPLYVHRATHVQTERPHDHDFLEVVVVLAGSADHACARGERALRRGDVVLLRPGAWHAYRNCRRLRIFNCCFGVSLLRHELAWAMDDPPLSRLLWSDLLSPASGGVTFHQLPEPMLREAEEVLDRLAQSLGEAAARRAGQVGQLLVVLDLLAGAAATTTKAAPVDRTPPGVWAALRLMEEGLAYAWTSQELAARVGLDRSYLVRRFKRATGLPPLAYLARRRAERAAALLTSTDRPITTLAADVGWPDPAYFARRFRQQFAMTAGEYRARFRQQSSS